MKEKSLAKSLVWSVNHTTNQSTNQRSPYVTLTFDLSVSYTREREHLLKIWSFYELPLLAQTGRKDGQTDRLHRSVTRPATGKDYNKSVTGWIHWVHAWRAEKFKEVDRKSAAVRKSAMLIYRLRTNPFLQRLPNDKHWVCGKK